MRTESQTPWLNVVQYPFMTREYKTDAGWLHYVDEGRGRPLVFLHGAPSWSYMWRGFVPRMKDTYRCVLVDHLGFGLSDKPIEADYSPTAHAQRLGQLLDYLGLDDVTLVMQDHGGPIGLGWAMKNVRRVHSLVVFNSWCDSVRHIRPTQKLATLVGHPLNRLYYRMLQASPAFIMPALFADAHCIPRNTQIQYLEPFRGQDERDGLYVMIAALKDEDAYYRSLWDARGTWGEIPALLLWGELDPLYGRGVYDQWREALQHHSAVRFPNHGRFLAEEATGLVADEIRWFLMNEGRPLTHVVGES